MGARQVVAAILVCLPLVGCLRACEACGVEVVDGEDMKPLPTGEIGPRGIPTWTPLDPSKIRPYAEKTTRSGQCPEPKVLDPNALDPERDHDLYSTGWMGTGSAQRLRGKVAVLDLRIASADGEPWSKYRLQVADDSALATRTFLQEKATEQGVELSIDILSWFVTTKLPQIQIELEPKRGFATPAAQEKLRADVGAAVQQATGTSIASAVQSVKSRGYAQVAVVVTLPTVKMSRELALPTRGDGVDIAFVQFTDPLAGAGIYAHELVHLFGADDLYRLTKDDPNDAADLMRSAGFCGIGGARIQEATAYAIGWRSSPPKRAYGFDR